MRSVLRGATLALLAIIVHAAQLQAQAVVGQIAGVVVSTADGAPVPAALIALVEPRRSDATHDDGTFSFGGLVPGRYTLMVQRIGFDRATTTVDVAAGQVASVRITLRPSALELAPTVTTGTVRERERDEVLSPTSVISGAELERRLAGTVGELVQREPGVAVTSMGGATSRPVIRGLGGDRIVLLEDGARAGDMSATSPDHAVAIEPLTAQQVEVVRGPLSLLYGSSALGGVVNVVRQEIPNSRPEHPHGAFTFQGNSVNTGFGGGGHAVAALGPVSLRAEGVVRRSENVQTPVGEILNTEANTYSASAGASFVGTRGYAGASYRFHQNEYGIPGGFVGAHEDGVNVWMRRHAVRAETDTRLARGPIEGLRAVFGYTNYSHAELEDGVVGTWFDQDVMSGNVSTRHGVLGPFAEGAFGFQAQYRDVATAGALRTPSTYDWSVAGFVVEEAARGPFRLQGGLRYDVARYVPREQTTISIGGERIPVAPRNFGSVSGSFGTLYELTDGVRLGASISRAYRTPDFNELYSDGPHLAAYSYDVGDPTLNEETGTGFDLFARVNKNGVRAEVATFRNQMNDFIYPQSRGRDELGSAGGRPRFQYTGKDAVLTGAEGDIEWSVTPRVVLGSTVSYVRGRLTEEPDPIPASDGESARAGSWNLPLMPPVNGSVRARYEWPMAFAGAELRWAGAQNRLGDFEEPTAGYTVGGLNAGYRVLAGGFLHSIVLSVDNVTNREYRDHLSRIKSILPEPGRSVSLLYRLTF